MDIATVPLYQKRDDIIRYPEMLHIWVPIQDLNIYHNPRIKAVIGIFV